MPSVAIGTQSDEKDKSISSSITTSINTSTKSQQPIQSTESEERPKIQEVRYIRKVSNPCCCSLQSGILWIALIEMFGYCIGVGATSFWYAEIITWPAEDEILPNDTHAHGDLGFYEYQQGKGYTIAQINEFVGAMAMAQIILFSINILLSLGLVLCSIQRMPKFGTIWIIGVCLTSVGRLILMIMAPMYVFEFGMISFLIEMYYMWCVSCFVTECKLYPNGVEYANDAYLPWLEQVEFEPYYGYGYQLIDLPPLRYDATVVREIQRNEALAFEIEQQEEQRQLRHKEKQKRRKSKQAIRPNSPASSRNSQLKFNASVLSTAAYL